MCFIKFHVSEECWSIVELSGGVGTLRNVSAYHGPMWHIDAKFVNAQGHEMANVQKATGHVHFLEMKNTAYHCPCDLASNKVNVIYIVYKIRKYAITGTELNYLVPWSPAPLLPCFPVPLLPCSPALLLLCFCVPAFSRSFLSCVRVRPCECANFWVCAFAHALAPVGEWARSRLWGYGRARASRGVGALAPLGVWARALGRRHVLYIVFDCIYCIYCLFTQFLTILFVRVLLSNLFISYY